MAEFIKKTDTLNEGREKINAAIQDAEDAKTTARQAVNVSEQAKQIAQTAENKADNVQEQFNQVVIEGDSSVEAAQARVDADGNTFTTLKERLDTKETQFSTQLAHKAQLNDNKELIGTMTSLRPFITFVDDDGFKTVMTVLKPMFESRGKNFVTAVPVNTIGNSGRMTKDDLLELENNGHEIASHGLNHLDLTTLSDSQLDYELRESLKQLRAMGLKTNNIVYPFGGNNEKVRRKASEYYRMGVSTSMMINSTPINQYRLHRHGIGPYSTGNFTRDDYKNVIDRCFNNKEWLIFMTHVNDSTQEEINDIAWCLDYAISLGIEIGTLNEGFEIFGNNVYLSEHTGTTDEDLFYIETKTGEVFENLKRKSEITVNTQPSQFPGGTTDFALNETDGFPGGEGTLINYRKRGKNLGFGYQIFIPTGENSSPNIGDIYFRRATIDNLWTRWFKILNSEDLNMLKNEYTANTPASEFPHGKVTTFYVNAVGSEGFPTSAGIVTTYVPDNFEHGFSRQEFRAYNSVNTYARFDLANGSGWSEWHLVSNSLGTV